MSDCDAAHLEAGSCKIGLENKDSIIAELNTKIAADKDKIDALTIERDKAKQTVTKVQGGSAFVRAAKTVGIVAGAGLVGYGLHAATH